ncbi:MAG: (2Fe-2S)-binding protein [Oscillospiraceae bacterium]|jgi:predicted molibdopterin-dependent oxidoreductase YjgC|nr:(2Fe-2S)-binding protein [Oscillospiraceae bacterium]
MRVLHHPVLGDLTGQKTVTIYYGEEPVEAFEGEPVAAALLNAGIRVFRKTAKRREPRSVFCAIGRCTDCMMIVDGIPNTRTCVTAVRDGMRVQLQDGLAPVGIAPEAGGR